MSHETIITFSKIILLSPLIGFVLMVFFGKKLPRQGDWLATGILFIAFILSCAIFFSKLSVYHEETIRWSFTWADFGNVPVIG